ncbi:DNA-protecting protein DprA, partial [bacterium (Candidatus Gribaldobacteria) CG_4_10_14_0_2_um_filter_36_18]
PLLLKKIANPPKILYIKGELLKKEKCFAIVGTRRSSNYGKEIAFSIAKDLSEAGLTIVSGMARGIDTFAHKGALDVLRAGGRTIAVLGTGIDEKSLYPKENLKLARKILENKGCLVSEYPPGSPGLKQNFPERNRIISGLSLGVLIVEAKFGSGALITANWAKIQGKKIFALPGSIHFPNSQGCHFLIKQGAKLAENANDILKEFNLPCLTSGVKQVKGKTLEEQLILEVLKQENLHIDKIIEKTKLSPQVVSSILTLMEIENKVKNLGGNVYIITR